MVWEFWTKQLDEEDLVENGEFGSLETLWESFLCSSDMSVFFFFLVSEKVCTQNDSLNG